MTLLQAFLPGRFEDAYVYMGWLVLLREDRSLSLISLDTFAQQVSTQTGLNAHLAKVFFRRNDWLSTDQFLSFWADESFRTKSTNSIGTFPRPFAQLDAGAFARIDAAFLLDASIVLDWLIYYENIYVCSDKGFFSFAIDWQGPEPALVRDPIKLHDGRCVSTTARFGAVGVSCGDDGLFGSWPSQDGDSSKMRRIDERSQRASWLTTDLVNYRTASDPEILRTERKATSEREGERQQIIDIGRNRWSRDFLFDRLATEYRVSTDEVQYVFNSRNIFFVHTFDGHFFGLELTMRRQSAPRVKLTHTYKGPNVRILSAFSASFGTLIETDDTVWLFREGQWTKLWDGEVLSVRAFPSSKHFQNIALVTTEHGVCLTAVLSLSEPDSPSSNA